MACAYLKHYSTNAFFWKVSSCSARDGLYVPSLAELQNSCKHQDHALCPYFLMAARQAVARHKIAPLPQAACGAWGRKAGQDPLDPLAKVSI